jgi:hypothetical protein
MFECWWSVRCYARGHAQCAVLRMRGLKGEKRFEKYHRVLSRARWSGLVGARILLGLKWISMMLLVPCAWRSRPWALPFLTVLAPSRAANEKASKPHRTPLDWAWRLARLVSRWVGSPLGIDGRWRACLCPLCSRGSTPRGDAGGSAVLGRRIIIANTDNKCGQPISASIASSAARALADFIAAPGKKLIPTGFAFPNSIGFGNAIFERGLSPPHQGRPRTRQLLARHTALRRHLPGGLHARRRSAGVPRRQ